MTSWVVSKRQRIVSALFFVFLLSPAHASLTLCNRTSYVLYAATASLSVPDVAIQGWTRIAPAACELALKSDLSAQANYVYARTSRAHSAAPRAWSGQINLCVKDSSFTLRLPFGTRCPADGYELPFAQIDTHHMRSWTTTFRETPDLPSMAAAERAGLIRLLGDTGVRGLGNDKQLDAALAQFRKRLHLQDAAQTDALFSALETEAMKIAVPVGYTVCNDTDKPFWTAVGQQKGATFSSKGWWTVAGGSCSHLITDSIAGGRVWLRVERGGPLVSGPMPFCVTNIEFDVQGRDNCAKRGLNETGFMETNIKRLAGYTAHVSGTGLAAK